jgi:lysozyme family protein
VIRAPEDLITEMIEREGREYSNRAADRGGPTKFGVTQKTLSIWRRRPVSALEVEALEEWEARKIYEARYLLEPGLHKIADPYVLSLAFDIGVNHGTHRAVQWLQHIVGVDEDGDFGPRTELAVNTYEPVRLFQHLLARRIEFVGAIIAHDPELKRAKDMGLNLQAENALGWARRTASFLE